MVAGSLKTLSNEVSSRHLRSVGSRQHGGARRYSALRQLTIRFTMQVSMKSSSQSKVSRTGFWRRVLRYLCWLAEA